MQVFATMDPATSLADTELHARRVEALGFDGLHVPDAIHDGLLTAHAALRSTRRITVATSVLVAFPRSPMNVAHASWDLQASYGGRFELGLGSQVRGNIVGRFSTVWSPPIPRMREYVQSLRAIFACWQDGERLDFRGEHYQFTRMQPYFNPGPLDTPGIRIVLGAVGPKMTRLAGELADGMTTHPTHSDRRYLKEVTLPGLAAGAADAGRELSEVALCVGPLVATGTTEKRVAEERERIRQLLTFLYSTPSYWPTLELHGFGELGRRLRELTRAGQWSELEGLLPDAILDAVVPTGTHAELASILRAWYGGIASRIALPVPAAGEEAGFAELLADLHADTRS